MSSKQNFFKAQALYFKNLALKKRYHCVAHLEGNEDKDFWQPFFERYMPDKRILFLTFSRNEKGRDTSGVDHCLKYRPYLSKSFFLCIDSDYRYLLQERNMDVKHFIFQTYTYSIENHYCYAGGLSGVTRKSSKQKNNVFDFEDFLHGYSKIVYPLLLMYLYFTRNKIRIADHALFFNLVNLHSINNLGNWDIKGNSQALLNALEERVNRRINSILEAYDDLKLKELQKHYEKLGLTANNAYLYMRGHDVFDIVEWLGLKVGKHVLNNQKEHLSNKEAILELYQGRKSFGSELKNNLQFDEYPEIEHIKEDIEAFFTKE